MKKCFSTLSTYELSMEEVIALAKANNIQGIEIRMSDFSSVFGRKIENATEVKNGFSVANIKIVDLATSVFIRDYDISVIRNAKSCIDYACALNCTGIRVFLAYSEKGKDVLGICKSLNELADYAMQKNVEIWIETHSEFSTGKSVNEILNSCNKENIKVIWDLIHTVEYDESPQETVEQLTDKIVHIHIKDGKYAKETFPCYKQTALGKGTVPVKEMYEALKKTDYSGYVSLEWEEQWHPELKECYKTKDDLIKAFIKFAG